MTLEQELRVHIVNECLTGEDPETLPLEENLIDSGLLDSLTLMQLVAHLQSSYGVKIPAGDITRENFSTVTTLAACIRGVWKQ
jgi:acyl carrier protein